VEQVVQVVEHPILLEVLQSPLAAVLERLVKVIMVVVMLLGLVVLLVEAGAEQEQLELQVLLVE
jgi:hypothetical protein